MCAAPPPVPHVPVLIGPLLDAVAPVAGHWIDGTFGAGGYAVRLLAAGAERVTGIDRDPLALQMAEPLLAQSGDRLALRQGEFADLDSLAGAPADGVVLDLGVSSMQFDRPERGFSFAQDGPLDMRMSQAGPSAADIVNGADEDTLADILFHFGDERAARRIARAVARRRAEAPIETTGDFAALVEGCLPRAKPGQSHPATRSFQALRIAVNDEYGQLVAGLEAAERALVPGGALAVVTFHSGEDRVVKRFLQMRSGRGGRANRFAPETEEDAPRFAMIRRSAIAPEAAETAANPRARSAKLRVARRTDVPAGPVDRAALGLPKPALEG